MTEASKKDLNDEVLALAREVALLQLTLSMAAMMLRDADPKSLKELKASVAELATKHSDAHGRRAIEIIQRALNVGD